MARHIRRLLPTILAKRDPPMLPANAAPPPLLTFVHIPKTAGTTLWLILQREYGPHGVLRMDDSAALNALTKQQCRETRVLVGHFPLSVPLPQSIQPPQCITVLREPLEQVLSHYCHVQRFACEDGANTPLALGGFLASELYYKDNLQTRMLAGAEAMALPLGACSRDVFEQAKHNLTTHVAVAGLAERFDENVVLMQRRFGWKMPCYVRENVGVGRLDRSQVPDELLQVIWHQNSWDRELYAFAALRLEQQMRAEGAGFPDAVRRFRLANIRYRRMKALVGSGLLRAWKSRLPLVQQRGLEAAARSLLAETSRLGYSAPAGPVPFVSDLVPSVSNLTD